MTDKKQPRSIRVAEAHIAMLIYENMVLMITIHLRSPPTRLCFSVEFFVVISPDDTRRTSMHKH